MSAIIAYCGLMCQTCPIYLATREDDITEHKRMRVEIARQIKKHYGEEYKPEDISDCDGCKTKSGRLFSGSKNCYMRKCAKQKGFENCAHCNKYACERIEKFFATDPDARARLDAIRREL